MGAALSKSTIAMNKQVSDDLVLSVSGLGVCYRQKVGFMQVNDFWPIKDVTFNLYRGETLGIIGKNGTGKSTLLKTLAGIIEADSGSVETFDASILLLGLMMGFVQDLSGKDNAIINGMLQGMSRKEVEDKIDDIIEFSELKEYFYQPVKNYSDGMKARLRFAVAIQANPDILLIDELLGVGDLSFKEKSSQVIRSRINQGQTAVVVSHDMNTLKELCSRIIWIDKGKTRLSGDVETVIREYEANQKGSDTASG